MNKYKSLYMWMIIPLVIMQLGIFMDYWGDLSENAWSVHVHYWTGTVWYVYLVVQPYLVTNQKIELHRTNGIIGMFIAGGVCLTALSMMHRDIASAEGSLADPERFGPFQPWFFYGIATVEVVMIVAFAYAVIKSILHRKEIQDHAWWLISTVFIIMMPALARGVLVVLFIIQSSQMPRIDVMPALYVSEAVIIALLLLGAWKFGTLRHPATYLALGVNLFNCLLEPLGRSDLIQVALRSLVKG